MKCCNYRVVCLWTLYNVCHLKAGGFRDFGDTCRQLSYFETTTLQYEIRETEEEEETRHEGQHLAFWRELHYRAVGQTENTQRVVLAWLCIIYSIQYKLYIAKGWKRRKQKETIRTSRLELLRHHDTAGQWLTVPQALLSEDAGQSGQPSATETTHAPRQRVQEPHVTGRHQCVWDRERR